MPGIARRTENAIIGDSLAPEFGSVGFAQQDAAGPPYTLDHHGILDRNVMLKNLRAKRRADAGGDRQILKLDGHAMEGSQRFSLHRGRFRLTRRTQRCFGDDRAVSIELGIQLFDPI
jgi:hypothetical protein